MIEHNLGVAVLLKTNSVCVWACVCVWVCACVCICVCVSVYELLISRCSQIKRHC